MDKNAGIVDHPASISVETMLQGDDFFQLQRWVTFKSLFPQMDGEDGTPSWISEGTMVRAPR